MCESSFFNIELNQKIPHDFYEEISTIKYPQSSILKYVVLLVILNKCLYEHIHIKSTDWEMTMKSMSIRCRFDDLNRYRFIILILKLSTLTLS